MQQEKIDELITLIGAVTTGIIRSRDTFSSFRLVRQEQAMGKFLRDAKKKFAGDPGVEPVVSALMKKQTRNESKQPIDPPEWSDDEIMARLAALDEMLADNEKSFKPFLLEMAGQIVKASASAGFLGIGRSTSEKETAFLQRMKNALSV